MANAKSTIYPIQLQGAELNLNKYDAEIKQYRGFNKNNSPFVGGCLSNVFTKEETVTSGNDDNVYIDTNGDVYRIDTEGLYLNEKKVIDYEDTNTNFYEKEEIKAKSNVVKLIDEDIYIECRDGQFYIAHWGEFYEVLYNMQYESYFKPKIEINKSGNSVVFSIKFMQYNSSGNIAFVDLNKVIYVPDINESTFYIYGVDRWTSSPVITSPFCHTHQTGDATTFHTQAAFFDDDNLYYASNSWINNNLVVINRADGTVSDYNSFTSDYPNPLFSSSLDDWHITNDGWMSIYKFPDITPDNNKNYLFRTAFKIENDSLIISSTLGKYLVGKVYNTSNYEIKFNSYNRGIFKSFCFGTVLLGKNTDTTKGLYINLDQGFNGATSYLDNNIACNTGRRYKIGNFILLFYAEELVNISVCRNGDLQGNIIEDWNIVDVDSVSFIDDYVIYRTTNDQWFKVYVSVPKLKFVNNQIVINSDNIVNSFDTKQMCALHFAADWNCSYYYTSTKSFYTGNLPTGNNTFLASAINEYNLKNNPSIILNMQGIIDNISNIDYFTSYYVLIKSRLGKAAINYYFSPTTDNEAVYRISGSYEERINEELEGLPFPNNTDGNVPYNPNLFSEFFFSFGYDYFIRNNNNAYQLSKSGQDVVMSFYLGTLIENLDKVFIIQGQYYGLINDQIFYFMFNAGVVNTSGSIVSVKGLQFVGNTPYEALFFSKTNRCLYSFTGANVLNQKQLVDKISEVRNYLYNPATQTVFLITDIGVLFYGLFGMFLLEYTDISNIFLLDNGIVMSDNSGNYRYIKYYLDEGDTDYIKQNIKVDTCFYGMNNQTVTINDCLYFRLFSEEHEEGELKVSATTISLSGRKTEETTFKIKASDWDKITHTIYLRYQPKTQRGLGVSFSIDSPFKIASLSVGSQPDAILVDKVSKGAITAPSVTTNNNEW